MIIFVDRLQVTNRTSLGVRYSIAVAHAHSQYYRVWYHVAQDLGSERVTYKLPRLLEQTSQWLALNMRYMPSYL